MIEMMWQSFARWQLLEEKHDDGSSSYDKSVKTLNIMILLCGLIVGIGCALSFYIHRGVDKPINDSIREERDKEKQR